MAEKELNISIIGKNYMIDASVYADLTSNCHFGGYGAECIEEQVCYRVIDKDCNWEYCPVLKFLQESSQK